MPEADLKCYLGREQAYVKHCLLEKYLERWARIVGTKWDSLVYVDAFSGPWETKDEQHRDSSFAIAGAELKKALQGLHERHPNLKVRCILIEQNREQFPKLQKFAEEASAPGFDVIALQGDFVQLTGTVRTLIAETSQNPFTFFFLDPKGWKPIPMAQLLPLLKNRSCEVLINIMTGHIVRFLDHEGIESSYHDLFGRPDALRTIQKYPSGSAERMEATVREYCRSLRDLCEFDYVAEAVIMEPDQERIRYFLIFATHYYLGIEVFKEAESNAVEIQNLMRERSRIAKLGCDPDTLRLGARPTRKMQELTDSYLLKAKERAAELLLRNPGRPVRYRELFCKAMAFPLVTPKNLNHWLCEHLKTVVEIRRADDNPSKPSRRQLSAGKEDYVILRDPPALELDLKPQTTVMQGELF